MNVASCLIKRIAIAALGFLIVLILTAMSAMGFAEERRSPVPGTSFDEPVLVVLQN
jgi:hypothetical protein